MDSLKQYLELYEKHTDLICQGSPEALNALRPGAAEVLTHTTLPKRGDEHFAVADLEKALAPDYGLNIARVPMEADVTDVFKCGVPSLPAYHFYLANDTLLPSSGADNFEWKFISLREAADKLPQILTDNYGSVADMKNPIVALNTLLCQDGVMLYVPAGVKVSKPIQIVNLLQATMPYMAVRRVLVVLGDHAEATVVACDHTHDADNSYLTLQTIEMIASSGSRLQWYDLEESTPGTVRLSTLYASIEGDAHVSVNGMTISNGHTRNEYFCTMHSPGSELELMGMAIEDGSRTIDTYSRIEHKAGSCHSNELFKYVADDKAQCGFEGLILVDEGATRTESFQANRNLVGSDEAKVFSRPQLEIYNDDVKCSHGSAIGQLDEMQLFYMQTRGINSETARLLLKQAFMADVIGNISLEPLRQRLTLMVERRMSGDATAGCAECKSNC